MLDMRWRCCHAPRGRRVLSRVRYCHGLRFVAGPADEDRNNSKAITLAVWVVMRFWSFLEPRDLTISACGGLADSGEE